MIYRIILYFLLLGVIGCRGQAPVTSELPDLSVATAAELQELLAWAPGKAPIISAHRGGPVAGYPENCMATFERTLSIAPAMLEMDVAMTRDSVLILMHDASLDRTTNGTGKVDSRTCEEIRGLKLKDNDGQLTEYAIPTLEEALAQLKGRCLLSLDVKRGVPFDRVVGLVQAAGAEGSVVVITYSAKDAKTVYELAPELMLSVSIRNAEELEWMRQTGIPWRNMVAFTGTSLKDAQFYDQLHQLGISCILGTLGNLDNSAAARGDQLYSQWRQLGADIFATDRPEAVAKQLYQ
jgi:glycerophosphoryl diester phosphodiesterase